MWLLWKLNEMMYIQHLAQGSEQIWTARKVVDIIIIPIWSFLMIVSCEELKLWLEGHCSQIIIIGILIVESWIKDF